MKPLFPWRWVALAYLVVLHVLFMLNVGDVVEGQRTITAVSALRATMVLLIGMLLGWLAGSESRGGDD